MKTVLTGVVAGLMMLGTVAAVVAPKPSQKTMVANFSDGGPVPLCLPTDPGCKPPIPPAR